MAVNDRLAELVAGDSDPAFRTRRLLAGCVG